MSEKIFPPSARKIEESKRKGNLPVSQELKNATNLIGLYFIYKNIYLTEYYLIIAFLIFMFCIFIGTLGQTQLYTKQLTMRVPFNLISLDQILYLFFLNIIKIIIIYIGLYSYFYPKVMQIILISPNNLNILQLIKFLCDDFFLYLVIIYLIIAIGDVLWINNRYYNQMYMTKEEYIQELKDSGDHKSATKQALKKT